MFRFICVALSLVAAGLVVGLGEQDSARSARWSAAAPSRGRVVDESGTPLRGVRYWVSGNEERTADDWQVVFFSGVAEMRFTDEEGRFEIPGRTGLRSDLDFDLSGFVPVFVQGLEPGQERSVVMQRGFDVRGRVRQRTGDGESSVDGARVSIRRPNPRGLWFQTDVATDSAGEFVFPGFLARANGAEITGPKDAGWQLVCAGASFDLPERVARAIDDLEVEVAIRRGD